MSMTYTKRICWIQVCPNCKQVIDKSIICCLQQFLKFNVKINFSDMK